MSAYPRNRIAVYLTILVLTLAMDLGTKEWIFRRIGAVFAGEPPILDGWLRFQFFTSLNRGALWGIGQGFAPGFAVLSAVALTAIVFWLFFRNAAESLWLTIALAMVSGGTLGNMYDRLGLHGVVYPGETEPALAVRDFLRFRFGTYDYPIFNLADSFLVAGAIMLMIQSFRDPVPQNLQKHASTVQNSDTSSAEASKGN